MTYLPSHASPSSLHGNVDLPQSYLYRHQIDGHIPSTIQRYPCDTAAVTCLPNDKMRHTQNLISSTSLLPATFPIPSYSSVNTSRLHIVHPFSFHFIIPSTYKQASALTPQPSPNAKTPTHLEHPPLSNIHPHASSPNARIKKQSKCRCSPIASSILMRWKDDVKIKDAEMLRWLSARCLGC